MIDLPFTQPLNLNVQRKQQHWQIYRDKNTWTEALILALRRKRIPACERVTVQLIYVPRDARRRDPLNLVASLKVVEDAVVKVGIIPDDDPHHLESLMPLIDAPEKDPATRLVVIVERVL